MKIRSVAFYTRLLTDRQTDRQTDKRWVKHYLLGGGKYTCKSKELDNCINYCIVLYSFIVQVDRTQLILHTSRPSFVYTMHL